MTPLYDTTIKDDICIDPFTWVKVHPVGEARRPFVGYVLAKKRDDEDLNGWRLLVARENGGAVWVWENCAEKI